MFEGSLLKCKNEFQEKKIPFMANIFAEVAFRDDVSTALAHQVYVIADRMTYRQLLIVATVHRKEEIAFDTTKWNTSFTMCFIPGRSRAHVMTDELAGFMRELYALSRTGEDLLSYDRTSTVHHGSEQGVLTMLGRLVYELMRLDQIDVAELVSLKDEFVRITGIP
ncbi:MAG: hypothetical protein CMJ58_08625 [Planctomycetaceae bacterium]|nr:hypothetical protein [Planctomycetaceae bacterium]